MSANWSGAINLPMPWVTVPQTNLAYVGDRFRL